MAIPDAKVPHFGGGWLVVTLDNDDMMMMMMMIWVIQVANLGTMDDHDLAVEGY